MWHIPDKTSATKCVFYQKLADTTRANLQFFTAFYLYLLEGNFEIKQGVFIFNHFPKTGNNIFHLYRYGVAIRSLFFFKLKTHQETKKIHDKRNFDEAFEQNINGKEKNISHRSYSLILFFIRL